MARALAVVILLPAVLTACPKKKGNTGPDASANAAVSSAPPVTSATMTAAATPTPSGPKASEKAASLLADVKATIAKDAKTKKSGNDVQVVCDALENEKVVDAEHKQIVDEAKELCAFDVPLYIATEALDQMGKTPSQASVLLSCKVASRELAKAKAAKPNDKHYKDVRHRFEIRCPGVK
jgi:hypothetical protein